MHVAAGSSVHRGQPDEAGRVDRGADRQRVQTEAGKCGKHPRALPNVHRSYSHEARADEEDSDEPDGRTEEKVRQIARRHHEELLSTFRSVLALS